MKIRKKTCRAATIAAVGVICSFWAVQTTGSDRISEEPLPEEVQLDEIGDESLPVNNALYIKEEADIPVSGDYEKIHNAYRHTGYEAGPAGYGSVDIKPLFTGVSSTYQGKAAAETAPPLSEEEEAVTISYDISFDGNSNADEGMDIPEDNDPEETIIVSENHLEPPAAEAAPPEEYASDNSVSFEETACHAAEDKVTKSGNADAKAVSTEASPEFWKMNIPETTIFADPASVTYETVSSVSEAPAEENAEGTTASIIYTKPEGGEILTARVKGEVQEFDAYELVCMIVTTEMSPSFSKEALKAQAVAAYSYVKYHNVKGLVPTVLVKTDIPPEVSEAVSEVFGKCVYYNGAPAQTMYTASTAGTTADPVNIWGGTQVPYLTYQDTSFDSEFDPNWGYITSYDEADMKSRLERTLGITLSDDPSNWLKVTSTVNGRYVNEVVVDGQVAISGMKLREKVLSYSLKSWAFDVSYSDGCFTFITYGYGHGVGMSQNGANYLGRLGYTYDQILGFYFPGTYIE